MGMVEADGVTVKAGVSSVPLTAGGNVPTAVRASAPPPPVSIVPVGLPVIPEGVPVVPVGLATCPAGFVRVPVAMADDRPVSVHVPLTLGAVPVIEYVPAEVSEIPFNPEAIEAAITLLLRTLPLLSYCWSNAP